MGYCGDGAGEGGRVQRADLKGVQPFENQDRAWQAALGC